MAAIRIRWKTVSIRVPILALIAPWCIFGHQWSGWFESLGRHAVGK